MGRWGPCMLFYDVVLLRRIGWLEVKGIEKVWRCGWRGGEVEVSGEERRE